MAGGPGIPVPHPQRPTRHGIVLFSAALTEELDESCARLEARVREFSGLVSEEERGMAAVTYLEQGEVALHSGDADEAALAFRRVLKIDPGDLSSIDRVQRATFVLEALERGETLPAAD